MSVCVFVCKYMRMSERKSDKKKQIVINDKITLERE